MTAARATSTAARRPRRFAFGAVALAALAVGRAALAGPPVPTAPAPVAEPVGAELSVPRVPAQMRGDDALSLLQQLGIPTSQPLVSGASSTAPAPPPGQGVSRTVELPAPSVVNRTPRFVFRDATRRDVAPAASAQKAAPSAAMETFRQSLVGGRSTP